MTDQIDVPNWLEVGKSVGIVCHASYMIDRVERFTKTTVVLEGGDKYPLKTLKRRNGTWSPTWELVPLADPRIKRLAYERQAKNLAQDIEHAMLMLRSYREKWDVARLQEARVKLDQLIKLVSDYQGLS